MRLLPLLLTFLSTSALASQDWERVDKRSETAYKASNYALLGGIAVSLGGSFSNQRMVQAGGDLLTSASMATMAGSSLRQRRSIVERGVQLSPAWGYTSWGLQAASAGLGAGLVVYLDQHGYDSGSEPTQEHLGPIIGMSIGSLACTIGAILTASKQHKENAFKRSMVGRADYEPNPSISVSLAPYFTADGSAGLGASAVF